MDSFTSGQLGRVTNVGNWHGGVPPQVANTTTLTKSIRTVTANDNIVASDFMILGDATAGNIAITLPNPVLFPGRLFAVKKIDATVNTVTIVGTIDAAVNRVLSTQWTSLLMQSNSAAWYIVSDR